MGFEFLGEVAFATRGREASEEAIPRAAQCADHAFVPFNERKRAMISVVCSHWLTSDVELFPAGLRDPVELGAAIIL